MRRVSGGSCESLVLWGAATSGGSPQWEGLSPLVKTVLHQHLLPLRDLTLFRKKEESSGAAGAGHLAVHVAEVLQLEPALPLHHGHWDSEPLAHREGRDLSVLPVKALSDERARGGPRGPAVSMGMSFTWRYLGRGCSMPGTQERSPSTWILHPGGHREQDE